MGGFLAGGDKNWRDSQVLSYSADIEGQIAKDREQRRSFLQNIREARMAQAYQEWAASSSDEYVTASGTGAAIGNIFSNFSGAYRYAIDQSNSLRTIENLNMLSEKLQKRAEHMDKRAVNNAKLVTGGLQTAGAVAGAVIGGMVGGPGGAMIGASIGSQVGGASSQLVVSGLHGGKAARKYAQHQTGQSLYNLALGPAKEYASSLQTPTPEDEGDPHDPSSIAFAKQAGKKPLRTSQNDYINKLNAAQTNSSSSGGFFNLISSFSSFMGS